MVKFEFNAQPVFMGKIEVEDLGNFALRAKSELGREYYVVVKTFLGKTIILKFGPLAPDLTALIYNMDLSFKKIDFKETAICREVDKFINDGRSSIVDIELISEMEALSYLPSAESILNSL